MIKSWFVDVLFIVLAGLFVFKLNHSPGYNWDMLPYMALVLEHSDENAASVHQKVYNIVREEQVAGNITAGTFGELTTDRIPYRAKCYADAEMFHKELSIYRTKPLYNTVIYLFYSVGVPLITATLLPSILFAFLLLAIFYLWTSRYVGKLISMVLALLLALMPVFAEIQNYATPDAMGSVFILLALYLFDLQKSKWLILLCLVLSILTRIDNVIFAVVVCYFLFGIGSKNMLRIALGGTVAMIFLLVVLPYMFGADITWFRRFKMFESHVQYYFHVRNVFRELVKQWHVILWAVAGVAMLFSKGARVRQMAHITGITVLLHLILFPTLQERYFVVFEFAVLVMLAMAVSPSVKKMIQPV